MRWKNIERIQPLVVAYQKAKNDQQMTFMSYGSEITISGCNEALDELLPFCNGVNQLGDILKELKRKYESNSLMKLTRVLLENEILIDSREFYRAFHKYSMNPPWYFSEMSDEQVMGLFRQKNYKVYNGKKRIPLCALSEIDSGFLEFTMVRKSGWVYTSSSLSFAKLSGLLKAAYGITRIEYILDCKIPHRTVPSAGALYPLEVYLVTLKDIECLQPGLYYFHKDAEHLARLKKGDFHGDLKGMVMEVNETIKTASLVLIVTARFLRGCEKYSNRGYRHILLEAGHLAQNVYLYCIDQNLDTVELSCFLDEALCRFLEVDPRQEAPITLLAIGSRS